MALAIDASTPAVATQTNGATATVATASFTPPSGSLLLIEWCANSTSLPAQPTITDNLGAHLTYTLKDWQSKADSPTKDGQSATWLADVATGAAMTVTVTNQATSGFREAALRVTVLTGQHATQNGTHGKGGSASSGALAQSVTGTATGSQAFGAVTDWDAKGSMTAGTGCTLNPASTGTGSPGGAFSYGFVKRSSADGTNGGSTTLNLTYGGTSTAIAFTYIEIVPAAGGNVSANAENAAGTGAADNAVGLTSGQSEGPAGSGAAGDATTQVAASAEGPAGSGVALDATVTASGVASAENATGSGAADNALASAAGQSEGPAGTGAALDATTQVAARGVENATGSGAAGDPVGLLSGQSEGPAGAGAANDVGASVFAFAECATGSGTANDAATQAGSNINADAECATGAGTANDGQVALAVPVENAAGGGASDNAIAGVTPQAQSAAATGTAPDAGALVSSQAEQATASGAASDPNAALQAPAENAAGSGAAGAPLAGVGGAAESAAGSGTANDAATAGSSSASGLAECATGAATAYAVTYRIARPGIYSAGARAARYVSAGRAAIYAVSARQASQTTGGTP